MPGPPETSERQTRLAALRADREIGAWFKDHRSPHTAEVQLQQLELFLRRTGSTAQQLIELGRAQRRSPGKDRGLQNLVQVWVDEQRAAGRPDSYVAGNWAAVRSWLKFSEAAPQWSPKLRVRRGATLGNETVPTQEDLARILSVLSARDRVIALLISHSGVRPGVVGNRFETNGLRLRDLPELDIRKLDFHDSPFMLVVPAELSKSGSEYVSFGSSESARALTDYLLQRRRRGEVLRPESAVVRSEPKTSISHRREFLSEKSISTQLRKGMAKVIARGKRWRAVVLRSYFSTQMESAERAGKTTRTFREALMGHTTSVEFAYHLGKRLHPEKIAEMRAAYKRCEPFLSTVPTAGADRAQDAVEVMMRYLGVPAEELEKRDLSSMSKDELVALAEKYKPANAGASNGPGQRAVSISEVGPMLESGWEYVAPLGADRAVLRQPPSPSPPSIR